MSLKRESDTSSAAPKNFTLTFLADFGIVLLIVFAIGLPPYIKWSASKLAYTPEPQFPAHSTKPPGNTGEVTLCAPCGGEQRRCGLR